LVWIGLDWFGLVWIGLDWFGLSGMSLKPLRVGLDQVRSDLLGRFGCENLNLVGFAIVRLDCVRLGWFLL
jgi:hypothetical protein